VKLRKHQALPPYYDVQDMEALLRQAQETKRRNVDAITILMDTGLRIGELVALRVGDVDLNKAVLVVRYGKGQKQLNIISVGRLRML